MVRRSRPQAAMTNTVQVGQAMLAVTRQKPVKRILEVADINAL